MAETKATPDDEVIRLRSRVKELEAELSRKQRDKGAAGREVVDTIRDTSNRAIDDSTRLFRAATMAYVEGLRLAANAMASFADEIFQRNQPEEETSIGELTRKLPGDIYSGFAKAIEQAVDIPRKTIDKFYGSYKEAEKS